MDHGTPLERQIASSLLHCRQSKNLPLLKLLHARFTSLGLSNSAVLGNYAVPAYVDCGSMADALHLFHSLPFRNEIAWTSLIRGHVEIGELENALACFYNMQEDSSVCPSNFTFVTATKACAQLKFIDDGRFIHLRIVKQGLESDAYVGSTVVDMYAKCGSLVEAKKVFDLMPCQGVVSWNALITGYTEYGPGTEALECFSQMQSQGSLPNVVTYICTLKACIRLKAIRRGQEIHNEIIERGLDSDPCLVAILVDAYAKCGIFEDATAVIGILSARGNVSWNSLISGYVEYGNGEEALKCLERMQLEGLFPNSVTFICSLRACSITGSLDKAREIHDDIVKAGFHIVQSISNSLIDAYVKCGSIFDANYVFDKLSARCIVSWTAIIAGYVEYGLDKDVLGCLNQMQLEGLVLDAGTYVIILKAFGNSEALCSIQDIYDTILKKGLDGNIFLDNTLMDLYAKNGSLAEAKAIFDSMQSRNLVSWNTLITGYAENGLGMESAKCFLHMQLDKTLPDATTCVASLKACGSIKNSTGGQEMHSLITKRGLDLAPPVGNSLVDMYVKCGSLVEARCVFNLLPAHTTVSWNTIITGLFDHGLSGEVLKCMEDMKHEDISLDATTYVCSLQICTNAKFNERAQKLHVEIVMRGLDGHSFIGSSLVDMYATCGLLVEAQKIFDLLPLRNVVTWTALISGYAEYGLVVEALECIENMLLNGILPNAITYACAFKACSNISALSKGQELYIQITKEGFPYDINGSPTCIDEDVRVLTNTIIDMYGKCGNMEDAHRVFDEMLCSTAMSWNALMTGYARCGACEEVFHLFDEVTNQGIGPDCVMFLNVLSVCSHGGLVSIRERCFKAMKKYCLLPTLEHYNCVIDLFARAGQLDEAIAMLETMPFQPNLVTLSTLLGACQNWSNIDLGRISFELMAGLDEKNATAFIVMFNIYAEAEMWEEAKELKRTLKI